jgi:hypothetical protein
VDLDTGGRWEVELRAGQRVKIHPGCAHRFKAEEDAQVIEYYDTTYYAEDDVPYNDFWWSGVSVVRFDLNPSGRYIGPIETRNRELER